MTQFPDDSLSEEDVEKMNSIILANHGMIETHRLVAEMHKLWNGYKPEFANSPWEDHLGLTKREYRFAKLHHVLFKLKVLKNLSDDENKAIRDLAIKRLKRVKWARYKRKHDKLG
jgi:hypothetical protein